MTSDKTSADKSFILEYVQLFVPETDDSITEVDYSSHIRNLGNILMPLTETWDTESLEQEENGFFIQFEQESDAVDFALSLLEKTKENRDFEVGVLIHSGRNITEIEKGIDKMASLAGPNKILVSELINLPENKNFNFTLVERRKIESDASKNEFDVFTVDQFSENAVEKESIFRYFNLEKIKWEFVIPILVFLCVSLFFILPRENPEPTIVVWMMENKGSADDDFLVWGMTEELIGILSLSQEIQVLPFEEISYASDSSPIEKAETSGMNYVFVSNFNRLEKGGEFYLSLVAVKNGKSEYSKKLTVSSKQLPEVTGFMAGKIKSLLDVNDLEIMESRISVNPTAYELYLKGKYLINTGEFAEQEDEGLSLLEESVKLDDNLLQAKSYLADLSRNSGDLSKARDLYTEAMTQAGEKGDKQKVREYLTSLGDIFLEMEDFPNALECYRNASDLAEEIRYQKNSPYVLNQIATVFIKLDETDSAMVYLNKSIKISHELNDSLQTVPKLLLSGNLYYNSGDYYNALIQFEKSLKYSKQIKDTTAISGALHHLSDIFWIKKDYSQALSYQGELLELLKKGSDNRSIAWAAFRLGSIYENQCDYVEAKKYLAQSLEIRQKLNDEVETAEVMGYLGIVSLNSGKYEKSQDYFNNSIKLYDKLKDRSGLGFMNHNLGESYFFMGKPEKSERYFRRALTIWRELKAPSLEIWSLSWLVLAEMKSGNREFEVDLYILNKMLKQNEASPEDIPVVHYNLYLVYEKKKIEEEARHHLKIAYNEIMVRAESLQSENDKNSFLTKNPLNRKILEAWEKLSM